jgi:uncharacterized HAD superfamily protein
VALPRLFIDVDGTLAFQPEADIIAVNARFGTSWLVADATDYPFSSMLPRRQAKWLRAHWPVIAANLAPDTLAIDVLRRAAGAGYGITVCTERDPDTAEVTAAWLAYWDIPCDHLAVVGLGGKGPLLEPYGPGSEAILVDDSPANVSLARPGVQVWQPARPYNEPAEGTWRFSDWNEAAARLMPEPGFADLAAEAYTAGWALTGAPLTERVKAGCGAAVAAALEYAHDPGILEATLDLGHLEGIWATVYARRDRLLRKHVKLVMAAWNDCVKPLDASQLVQRFRADAYLTSESATKDPQKQWWQDVATAAALGWLRAVYRSDGYDALVAAVEDAIRSGMAEGEADALALAASRQGKTGFSIAAAFKAAYGRLADDQSVSQQAADTVTRIIDGAGNDLGRRLASMAGSSADDMAAAIDDMASGDDVNSVDTGTDWALSAALLGGALSLYGAVNADSPVLLNWITAGDARVCPTCSGYEDNSPYLPGDVPDYPHPRCRCSVDLAPDSGSSSFLAALLDGFTN